MKHGPQRGFAAIRNLQLALTVAQSWPNHADLRMGIREADEPGQSQWRNDRVVIEEEDVPAGGELSRLIAGSGKSLVLIVANKCDFGEFASDHLGRSIRGSVIDYDHFDSHALRNV